jgi:microcystin-dependent protein
MPIGSILLFAVDAAGRPDKWLLCHGQAISRSHYAALFALVGTHFGIGDNSTTFNVPDFRERFPLNCTSDGFDEIGLKGGVADLALSVDNLPAHNHNEFSGNQILAHRHTTSGSNSSIVAGASNSGAILVTGNTGGDVPINLMNPYIKLQYCIYAGVSP